MHRIIYRNPEPVIINSSLKGDRRAKPEGLQKGMKLVLFHTKMRVCFKYILARVLEKHTQKHKVSEKTAGTKKVAELKDSENKNSGWTEKTAKNLQKHGCGCSNKNKKKNDSKNILT